MYLTENFKEEVNEDLSLLLVTSLAALWRHHLAQ